MRLLHIKDENSFSLVERIGANIPPYAILSHTWGADEDEVTFKDLIGSTGYTKPGYTKLIFCGQQAVKDNLKFFWVDTCCIDKSSSTELSEAINSMYRWYQNAAKCYVYLADVSAADVAARDVVTEKRGRLIERQDLHMAFRDSRWFTRGWTLQELLAPRCLEFFSVEGDFLGDRNSLIHELALITGIREEAFQGASLSNFGVEERMLWAKNRETKREEDSAYALLGIFDVSMPLIYGEGQTKALRRLHKEIKEASNDTTTDVPSKMEEIIKVPTVQPVYYIPLRENANFVGRSREIAELQQKLMLNRDCQQISIVGPSGIGKSQLALQFVYTVKKTWRHVSVFWLSATSMAAFNAACSEIVNALGIHTAGGEASKSDFQQTLCRGYAKPWILVLDDADNLPIVSGAAGAEGIAHYLPRHEDGLIICTTRSTIVADSVTSGNMIKLERMDQEDAAAFFKRSLLKIDIIGDNSATTELLGRLNGSPIDIAHAAAYLNTHEISIEKYLRLLPQSEQQMCNPPVTQISNDNARDREHKAELPPQTIVDPIYAEVRRKLVVVGDGMVGKTSLL